jgi:hypothetical protein
MIISQHSHYGRKTTPPFRSVYRPQPVSFWAPKPWNCAFNSSTLIDLPPMSNGRRWIPPAHASREIGSKPGMDFLSHHRFGLSLCQNLYERSGETGYLMLFPTRPCPRKLGSTPNTSTPRSHQADSVESHRTVLLQISKVHRGLILNFPQPPCKSIRSYCQSRMNCRWSSLNGERIR